MGSFDDILFAKAPVTCPCKQELKHWQSKDFSEGMTTIAVREDGFLVLQPPSHIEGPVRAASKAYYLYTACDLRKHWLDLKIVVRDGKIANGEFSVMEVNGLQREMLYMGQFP